MTPDVAEFADTLELTPRQRALLEEFMARDLSEPEPKPETEDT